MRSWRVGACLCGALCVSTLDGPNPSGTEGEQALREVLCRNPTVPRIRNVIHLNKLYSGLFLNISV